LNHTRQILNHGRTLTLITVLVALAGTAHGASVQRTNTGGRLAPTTKIGWEVYLNEEYGFELEYPSHLVNITCTERASKTPRDIVIFDYYDELYKYKDICYLIEQEGYTGRTGPHPFLIRVSPVTVGPDFKPNWPKGKVNGVDVFIHQKIRF
jgi:hypothetical protein